MAYFKSQLSTQQIGQKCLPKVGLGFGGMGHENYRIWIDQNMSTGSYISSGAIDTTYGTGPLVPDQKEGQKYLSIKSLEVWSPSGEQTFLNFKERQ